VTASGPEPGGLTLAAEFPAASREQWERLVAKVLGLSFEPGDAPERALASVTADGIEIAPLYTAGDGPAVRGYPGQAPFLRGAAAAGNRSGWDIRARHEHPSLAGEQVLEDLEGGVTSLWLGLGDGQIPLDRLPDVLAGVYLDLAGVVLDAGAQFGPAADLFLAEAGRRDVPAGALAGCLGADPLGVQARTGQEASLAAAAELAGRCAAEYPGLRAIVVDALPFHEAGATDAQELGCSLAAGVEYLRALRTAGLSAEAAFGQLEFRYAATADQFATLAKLRAARRVWARVGQECGGPGGQRQHVVTSWPMLTQRDPWNNILRAMLACFAAGAGGADAVTASPFDIAIGQPSQLARRVARNISALLLAESHVARVIDPAGGSWYVEDLTGQLAQRAWAFFQEIEQAGGLMAALASGLIAGQLAGSREARRDALARRRESITGVTVFPLAGETLLDRPPAAEPPRLAGGLPRVRWAQWHEELRDRADACTRSAGTPPAVTLALLDDSRASQARAEQVTALLAPLGLVTRPEPGPAVVVCGSAEAGEAEVKVAVERARAAGAALVVQAAGDVPAPGVAEVVAADMDVLALGERLLTALGVA
jgi:methylmalonyl-CoA mutase